MKILYGRLISFQSLRRRKNYAPFLFLLLLGCDSTNELTDAGKSAAERSSRMSGEPLVEIAYELESFTANQVVDPRKLEGDEASEFVKIGSQPHLERTAIDLRLFEDGSYQMTTIRMEPTRKNLLPEPLLKKYTRYQAGPFKTVSNNGSLTFYDEQGKEVGRHQLKNHPFAEIARKIKEAKPSEIKNIAAAAIGNPLINEAEIKQLAQERSAVILESGNTTSIRFELLDDPQSESSTKLVTQLYDFDKNRLLETSMFDKKSEKLIRRSVLFYDNVDQGNMVNRALNESYSTDQLTGARIRHFREDFYSNMKVVVNR